MEGSRLQKLEMLRDLTERYAEVAAGLGIVEDPTARGLVMDVLSEIVQNKRMQLVPAGPARRYRAQIILPKASQHPVIVAGAPCKQCGYASLQLTKSKEQTLRVVEVPRPRLRPPLRSDAAPKLASVAPIQRPPQRLMFKPLPCISREESNALTRDLIDILRRNPEYPRELRYGCFNCDNPLHSAKDCTWSRGTWCGRCGEVGIIHADCPRCYPEQYGLENKPFTVN